MFLVIYGTGRHKNRPVEPRQCSCTAVTRHCEHSAFVFENKKKLYTRRYKAFNVSEIENKDLYGSISLLVRCFLATSTTALITSRCSFMR
jgi:hypothetical protein